MKTVAINENNLTKLKSNLTVRKRTDGYYFHRIVSLFNYNSVFKRGTRKYWEMPKNRELIPVVTRKGKSHLLLKSQLIKTQ